MSNPLQRQISHRQKVRNIDQRVSDLERIMQGLYEALNALSTRFGVVRETVDAVIDDLGRERVVSLVAEKRVGRAKASLAAMLAEGSLVKTSTIGEKSIIVGVEKYKDGEGYFQNTFSTLTKEAQGALLGKGPGYVHHTAEGDLEITEVYDVQDKSADAPPAPDVNPTEAAAEADPSPPGDTNGAAPVGGQS
jgi:hypothetical protein